jgi:protein-disulfide isomerase
MLSNFCDAKRRFGEPILIITRRALTAALSLTGLAALVGLSPLRLITEAHAGSGGNGGVGSGATRVPPPPTSILLPDMALGPKDASVTITEYASMTCPLCAAFNENVFQRIKSTYIDTGKVRYVFREFPLDPLAGAAAMLSRCIAQDDSFRFFTVVELLFRLQSNWVVKRPREALLLISKQFGFSPQQVEACLKDQALLDKLVSDSRYASEVLKVDSAPTFFLNGEKIKGDTSFDEFDKRIKVLLNG